MQRSDREMQSKALNLAGVSRNGESPSPLRLRSRVGWRSGGIKRPTDADIALGVKDPQAVLQLNPRGRFSFSWKVEEGESLDGGLGDDD